MRILMIVPFCLAAAACSGGDDTANQAAERSGHLARRHLAGELRGDRDCVKATMRQSGAEGQAVGDKEQDSTCVAEAQRAAPAPELFAGTGYNCTYQNSYIKDGHDQRRPSSARGRGSRARSTWRCRAAIRRRILRGDGGDELLPRRPGRFRDEPQAQGEAGARRLPARAGRRGGRQRRRRRRGARREADAAHPLPARLVRYSGRRRLFRLRQDVALASRGGRGRAAGADAQGASLGDQAGAFLRRIGAGARALRAADRRGCRRRRDHPVGQLRNGDGDEQCAGRRRPDRSSPWPRISPRPSMPAALSSRGRRRGW